MASTSAAPTTTSCAKGNSELKTLRVQSEQSKFVQHLATYPALTAFAGLIASFPIVKIFASNAVPLLHAIHDRSKSVTDPVLETAEPYLRSLDNAGDAALTKIDRTFPNLQKVQPHDVYEDAHHYVDSVKDNAKAAYDARVAQPIYHATEAARNQYSSIYDSHIGARIAPINDKIESAIDQYLPTDDATKEPELVADTDSGSGQLKRTFSLARLAAERAAPKVANVYNTKLEEQTKGSGNPGYIAKLLAALATGKFLSVESYNHVLKHFGTTEKLEAAVEKVKATTAAYERELENAASSAVGAAENAAKSVAN